MSERDLNLLRAMELTPVQAAGLLGRTRQAIYAGLANKDRRYFGSGEVLLFLASLRRTDASSIDQAIAFIEAEYGSKHDELDQRNLILPSRTGFLQVAKVARTADSLVIACNENLDHLSKPAAFARVLEQALMWNRLHLTLILPAIWMKGYISDKFKLPLPENIVVALPTEIPTLVLTKASMSRGFLFGRAGVEEAHPTDAQRLAQRLLAISL